MEKFKYLLDSEGLAIWSAFPTVETYRNFKKEKRNISIANRFIELAYKEGHIPRKHEADFEVLLTRFTKLYHNRKPSMEFSFETLIKEIKRETSIKQLVTQLKNLAKIFGFEEPSEVLFTRLKIDFNINSLKKHHALILISIWLGLHKKELALNYPTLLGFPRYSTSSTENETSGVLVAFSFLGEHTNSAMIDFLKRELPICSRDLNITYLNEKRLRYLATTCTAKFPVKQGITGFPSSYGEAVRDALFLAYQIIICWQLSPLYDPQVHFAVALEAGLFDSAELTIKNLLLPDNYIDYPIRLSHFTILLAEQAEQKVVFIELQHPNVWAIEHFWAFPYLKAPHCLLPRSTTIDNGDEILPITDETAKAFSETLILMKTTPFNILSIINQYPPKTLTALEVSNLLTYRRLHHTAIRFLSIILSSNPNNYIARTMRMANFMFLGNCSHDLQTAELFYGRGRHDGEFVESGNPPDPVFYAEYSLLYWSKAIKLIKLLRKGLITDRISAREVEIIENIKKAEYYATKGTIFRMFSDTRCTTYLLHYLSFRRLIELNPGFLTDKNKPFIDTQGVFTETVKSILKTIGWLDIKDGMNYMEESLTSRKRSLSIKNYLNSLSSPSFAIGVSFLECTLLWDYSKPEQQKQLIDRVLLLINLVLEKTQELKKFCLGIYSLMHVYPMIQSPSEYINWILKAKQAIQEIKETGNYKTGLKLSMMHFDDEIISKPITLDLNQAEEI